MVSKETLLNVGSILVYCLESLPLLTKHRQKDN